MTYRVTLVLGESIEKEETHFTHTTKFAGCSSDEDAKRKAREIFRDRVIYIKKVEKVIQ